MNPFLSHSAGRSWMTPLLSLVALGIGSALAWAVFATAPEPKSRNPEVQARLVETRPLELARQAPQWPTGGQAMAIEQVSLMPRVSAQVVAVDPAARPGARLQEGDLLAELDPADFELAVRQARADLAQAEAALTIERGEVALAQEEYQLAGRELQGPDRALVLREPQLQSAEADVERARAALQRAELDLQRSRLRMPFDGQVISRTIAPGMQASPGTAVFDVVNTAAFWIEVKVPRQFLPYLDLDGDARLSHPAWQQPGSEVEADSASQTHRTARVLDVVPAVNDSDRLARVLLQLDDPLALEDATLPPVLLNDYLDVILPGKPIANAVRVPLAQLDDQNRTWLVVDGQLQQRQLEVAWRGRTHAWVTAGVDAGDQLLVSRIDAITNGMPVRIAAATPDNRDALVREGAR